MMGYYFISYRYSKGDSYGSGSCIKKGKRLTAKNKDAIAKQLAKEFGFDRLVIMYFKKVRRGRGGL